MLNFVGFPDCSGCGHDAVDCEIRGFLMSTMLNMENEDSDDEEDEDYVPGAEEDVDEEFAEEDLSDDPDKEGLKKPGRSSNY